MLLTILAFLWRKICKEDYRLIQQIVLAQIDGATGFPEAFKAVH
jgi:hypothetical protein